MHQVRDVANQNIYLKMTPTKTTLYPQIMDIFGSLQFDTIYGERKTVLRPLVDFIQSKSANEDVIRINFICTHNSRRSHLSQVWAQAAAAYYQIKNVYCYSGGTEATALFPMAAKVLDNAGFKVKALTEGKNPVYSFKYDDNAHPVIGFSKKLNDDFNPKSEFAAIMTCDSASEACPFVPGAEKRIPITFEDPKSFDGTPQQEEKYNERSMQIATEMAYVFSLIK